MVNDTPCFIVTSLVLGRQFKQDIKEIENQYPEKCHTNGMFLNNWTWLLTKLQYNPVEQKLNDNVDPSASSIIKGD